MTVGPFKKLTEAIMHKAKKLFIVAILLITLVASYIGAFHLNRFSFGNDQYTRLSIT